MDKVATIPARRTLCMAPLAFIAPTPVSKTIYHVNMKTAALITSLFILSACNTGMSQHDEADTATSYRLIDAIEYANTPSNGKLSTADETRLIVRAISEADSILIEAVGSARSWSEADLQVRDAIAAVSEAARPFAVQAGSATMLAEILPERPTEASMLAGAYYTRLLAKSGSPEAPLLLSSLQKYGDALAPAERQRLAGLAVDATELHLSRACDECRSTGMEALAHANVSLRGRNKERAEALPALRALADG